MVGLADAFLAACEQRNVMSVPPMVVDRLRAAEEWPHVLDLRNGGPAAARRKRGPPLTERALRALTHVLRAHGGRRLREVRLDFLKVGDHGAQCLARMLASPTCALEALSLVHCAIGDAGGAALCRDLGRLQRVDLTDNVLGKETVRALSVHLDLHKDSPLRSLVLDKNNLTDSGGALLCKAVSGSLHLERLGLVRCGLSFATGAGLASLRAPRLERIDVRHNAISAARLKEVETRLAANRDAMAAAAADGPRAGALEFPNVRPEADCCRALQAALAEAADEASAARSDAQLAQGSVAGLRSELTALARRCNDKGGLKLAMKASSMLQAAQARIKTLAKVAATFEHANGGLVGSNEALEAQVAYLRNTDVSEVMHMMEEVRAELRAKDDQIKHLRSRSRSQSGSRSENRSRSQSQSQSQSQGASQGGIRSEAWASMSASLCDDDEEDESEGEDDESEDGEDEGEEEDDDLVDEKDGSEAEEESEEENGSEDSECDFDEDEDKGTDEVDSKVVELAVACSQENSALCEEVAALQGSVEELEAREAARVTQVRQLEHALRTSQARVQALEQQESAAKRRSSATATGRQGRQWLQQRIHRLRAEVEGLQVSKRIEEMRTRNAFKLLENMQAQVEQLAEENIEKETLLDRLQDSLGGVADDTAVESSEGSSEISETFSEASDASQSS